MENMISEKAKIGKNVTIGYAVRIYDNVHIDDNCVIGDFCCIGWPTGGPNAGKTLYIGPNSIIRSHAVIYEGSSFKSKLETGHHVILRDGVMAGHNLRVGNASDIEGLNIIGDYVRIHGYVQIGRSSNIGSYVWFYSLVLMLNDPLPPSHLAEPSMVDEGAVICVGARIFPGVRVGKAAFVSANTCARHDVPPCAVVVGDEGKIAGRVDLLIHKPSLTRHPWYGHFADAYPPEAQQGLKDLQQFVKENAKKVKV